MAGTFDWKAYMDSLQVDPDWKPEEDLGRLSIDSFHAEHRGITVAELRAERDAARAERRAEFEAALDELITSARIHGQGLERLGWKIIQGVATAAGMRIEADEYVTVEGDRARVLALWDAKEA